MLHHYLNYIFYCGLFTSNILTKPCNKRKECLHSISVLSNLFGYVCMYLFIFYSCLSHKMILVCIITLMESNGQYICVKFHLQSQMMLYTEWGIAKIFCKDKSQCIYCHFGPYDNHLWDQLPFSMPSTASITSTRWRSSCFFLCCFLRMPSFVLLLTSFVKNPL